MSNESAPLPCCSSSNSSSTSSSASPHPSVSTPPPSVSFHRRVLPPPSISLSSPSGVSMFKSSLSSNSARTYFSLASHFSTQDEPAYCALCTLCIVLNAMNADPRRQWKGSVWRYYHESMLSCCADLEEVKKQGVTFATFLCLARCQGLVAEGRYADACGGPDGFEASFREALEATCRGDGESEEAYVCVSYSRGALGQTGSGHFSPLGCYDPEADAVLVLDTARFKYPPHWV
eukprot:CAMPEP_0182466220 /NCGR_PEP_ID=MMETSP1319-20130603/11646_1 /TAXON_ID=172717 /ORGANISM="Bolidomonas pacifica, Strain RCC208" /LENGTH=232 /DNA_ID=CAMNT_0024666179 /DNA_START=183 /DNA_END=877 /DNA_ORIENTATION=+